MVYKYNDSERFRANLYLLLGTALTTPFGIFIIEKLQQISHYSHRTWSIVGLMSVLGLTSIFQSYTIIVDKDEINDRQR
jgi:hypothetical protein